MNSRLAEYVLAIVETGSFRLAADRCFVTPPTVSIQIRALESLLGVKLFCRDPHPVCLTPEGASLLCQFRAIADSVRDLRAAATELGDGERSAPDRDFQLADRGRAPENAGARPDGVRAGRRKIDRKRA